MSGRPRRLRLRAESLTICRLEPDAPFPAWLLHDEAAFWSITRTPEELSIVCERGAVPPSVTRREDGWRALTLEGPVPLSTVGVAAALTAPLAAAGVPLLLVSTWDTDHVLVREGDLPRAVAALRDGYEVVVEA